MVGNKYLRVMEIFKIEAARPDKKLKDLRAVFQVNLDMVLSNPSSRVGLLGEYMV